MHRALPVILVAAFLCGSQAAHAFELPERPSGRVHDAARMLSVSARAQIEQELERFESETGNQIVVATFPSLEGASVEEVSMRLAQSWKLGQADRDNGVLLVVFREDRAVRIEVGYGLEGVLTDALCSTIIRNEIVPAFRAGDADEGIRRAVRALIEASRGEYAAPERPTTQGLDAGGLAGIALFLVVALPIVACLLLPLVGALYFGLPGFLIGLALAALLWKLRALFPMPNYATHRTYGGTGRHWGGGGDGGGGFGGGGFSGGGGSFGGGGASGRW